MSVGVPQTHLDRAVLALLVHRDEPLASAFEHGEHGADGGEARGPNADDVCEAAALLLTQGIDQLVDAPGHRLVIGHHRAWAQAVEAREDGLAGAQQLMGVHRGEVERALVEGLLRDRLMQLPFDAGCALGLEDFQDARGFLEPPIAQQGADEVRPRIDDVVVRGASRRIALWWRGDRARFDLQQRRCHEDEVACGIEIEIAP